MSESKLGVVLYRYTNDNLEVYLVQDEGAVAESLPETEQWSLPDSTYQSEAEFADKTGMATEYNEEIIPLEHPTVLDKVLALETQMEDAVSKFVEIRNQKGSFFAIKEAFKKVLPHQYSYLKELTEVLSDRNLTKFM